MVAPVASSYSVGAGQPVYGGRLRSGFVAGALLGATVAGGALAQQSGFAGGAALAPAAAGGVLAALPVVPSGSILNISLNTRQDINPRSNAALNPDAPDPAPWEGDVGWASDQLSEFCGAVFASDFGPAGKLLTWGAPGHSTGLEFAAWVAFDVATRRWAIIGSPPPTEYTTQAAWDGGSPPSTRADRSWGEWDGGSTDWPEPFRRPGYNPPFGSHTRNSFAYVPASAAGNDCGQVVVAWHATLGASGTGVGGGWIYNCDNDGFRRTANARPNHGSSVGGVAYHAGQAVVVGFNQESGGSNNTTDFLDLSTEQWTRRTAADSITVAIDSSTFVCGDLLVYVGNGSGSPPMTFIAAPVSTIKAGGSFSRTTLTVSASSWPTRSGSTATTQWSRCPVNGAWYAVNRTAGSSTLWKLVQPAGVADSDTAGLLAGTWTITSETLTGDTLEGALYDYSRLQWCPALTAFLWFGDLHTSNVQAIRPVGV